MEIRKYMHSLAFFKRGISSNGESAFVIMSSEGGLFTITLGDKLLDVKYIHDDEYK